ncbi:MAG: SDR family oxidoreductase [Proteobacteria bacterium]|nr:SDR family oxidoreductase [Pseudomonadota bacterium]
MKNGRVAIVTGAGRGIGKAIAKGLAADGFRVALISTSKSEIENTAREISSTLDRDLVEIFPGDVSEKGFAQRCVAELMKSWGRVDLLCNNAGIYQKGTLDLSVEQFERMIAVNLTGAFMFAQAVVPHLKAQGSGYIFNVSSICGVHGFPEVGGYTASKHGLSGLSECLYRELAPFGISVTSICPNWVNTVMAAESPITREEMIQPEDILKVVRFVLGLSKGATIPEVIVDCRSTPL